MSEDRPVFLNLTAVWSAFCQSMDATTFTDPERAALINGAFVPVRVDVDRMPHVQDRYIAGGWPTNTFLTPTGEVLWAGTYLEAAEFDEIAHGVITAWKDRRTQLRGEIEKRRKALDAARSRQPSMALVRREAADDVISGARQAFDARNGGFGDAPKFPYPDAIELLLTEARLTGDDTFVDMADRTLDGIIAGDLWDEVQGGFFRYALQADWTEPRREKLLEPNATLLRAFSMGAAYRDRADWRERAAAIVAWADTVLGRRDGLWASSQCAADEYWQADDIRRVKLEPPPPDTTLYAAPNAYWIRALADAGMRLGETGWIERAARALPTLLDALAAPDNLLRHFVSPDGAPSAVGLLTDSIEAARACVSVAQATGQPRFLADARRLVDGLETRLWADAGGFYDHVSSGDDVAAVRYRDRPFESNADAARLLLDLYYATGERSYRALVEGTLATLSPLAGRYEIAGAAFALGVEEFFIAPPTIVLVGSPEATTTLREAAFRVKEPNLRIWTLPDGGRLPARTFGARPAPAAYVCGPHPASAAIMDPAALAAARPGGR